MAEKNFKSLDSLKNVESVINEASEALNDKKRTIVQSAIPDVLVGALGAGIGGAGSFAAIIALAGGPLTGGAILHALAVAGGGVAAVLGTGAAITGIFVLAAPAVVLAAGGVGVSAAIKGKKLKEAKDRLLKLAIEKEHSINVALKQEVTATKERADYLNSLNILLQRAIQDLQADMV